MYNVKTFIVLWWASWRKHLGKAAFCFCFSRQRWWSATVAGCLSAMAFIVGLRGNIFCQNTFTFIGFPSRVCLHPKQVHSLHSHPLTGLILFRRTVSFVSQRCFARTPDKLAAVFFFYFLEKPNFTGKWQAEGILRTLPQLTLITASASASNLEALMAPKKPSFDFHGIPQNSFGCSVFCFYWEKKSALMMQFEFSPKIDVFIYF